MPLLRAGLCNERVYAVFYCQSRRKKGIIYLAAKTASYHQLLPFSYEENPDLAAVIENPTVVRDDTMVGGQVHRENVNASALSTDDVAAELGVWFSGLESFLSVGHYNFRLRDAAKPTVDFTIESRITQTTLMRCMDLNARLLVEHGSKNSHDLTVDELNELAVALRDSIQVGQCIVRAEPIGIGEWKAWCNLLSEKFGLLTSFHKLIRYAETSGEQFLPEPLKSFAANERPMSPEDAELALILPKFAKVLKWLSVVGKMLQADEPLKPALLIFARVNEQVADVISYINNRLARFPNEEAELFGSLDAASYTASIELKKVYAQELTGIADLRPPPAICAGMETAYAMLNESFQQTLAGLARLVDPSVDVVSLFPSYRVNFERSLALRGDLWKLVRLTQTAEQEPEKKEVDLLNRALREFTHGSIRFLFYKDTETFERFVEEILVTKQKKDLVPLLHRFGAYLETLFGQVSMRAVLENHPFEGQN